MSRKVHKKRETGDDSKSILTLLTELIKLLTAVVSLVSAFFR